MLYINTYKLLPPQDVAPKLNTHYYVLFSLILESCHISVLFSFYNDFPIFIIPSVVVSTDFKALYGRVFL